MIPDEEYSHAVRDRRPEMAFIYLESQYRGKLMDNLNEVDGSSAFNTYIIEYMSHTIAAARALDLGFLDSWSIPSHRASGNFFDTYKDFSTLVDQFKVRMQIQNAQGAFRYSVGLDADDKDKLRNYVEQIKKVIDATSLQPKKKERLFDLINAFMVEVDRDRAPWDRFADLVIGIAHLGGEATRQLEPARRFIDSIARLLGRAKEFEDNAPKLPPSQPPRQIPAPTKRLTATAEPADKDEEIPF